VTSADDARLAELLDKQAIQEALHRYCRGLDRLDADLIASVYHPDARENHSGLLIEGSRAGEMLVEKARDRAVSRHCITNILIHVDGDVADCESYWLALNVSYEGETAVVSSSHGRYVDRFERRDGAWKISRRVVVPEWRQIERQEGAQLPVVPFPSLRSRDDLSYSRLTEVW
jgi:hypothetical protein